MSGRPTPEAGSLLDTTWDDYADFSQWRSELAARAGPRTRAGRDDYDLGITGPRYGVLAATSW